MNVWSRGAVLAGMAVCCFLPSMANAQAKPAWEEYDRLLESRQAIAALSADNVFGDSLDLYSGTLSFTSTDVSIPGNSKLPVAVTRKFTVTNREGYSEHSYPFADWELDIPHVSGVFAPSWHDDRCDRAKPPSALGVVPADEFWAGNHADMPGGGEMLWVTTTWPKPSTGGPYKWVTAGNTYFSCLSSIANGTGQGFLAIAGDGTKYWFNHMARTREPSYKYNSGGDYNPTVTRYKVSLYATRIEDRFGNWVTYTYSNAATQPLKITRIASNEGRTITFHYGTHGFVSSVSDGSRSWSYGYQNDSLTMVTQPDTEQWQIAFSALANARIQYSSGDPRNCFTLNMAISGNLTGSITHPSGAKGTYTVGPVRFGRTNVPAICRNYQLPGTPDPNGKNDDYFLLPVRGMSLTLKSRQISGPGLTTGQWTYAWSGGTGSWQYPPGETHPICKDINCLDPVCLSDDCAGGRSVTIIEPDGSWTKHAYGNSYRYNEGKLLGVQTGKGSDVLRTVAYDYNYATSSQPYSAKIGSSPQQRGAGFVSEYPRPQRSRVITQDGATFSNSVNGNAFDDFARPLSVTKSSSLGYSRAEVTAYHDNLSKWVLGQVASVTCVAPATSAGCKPSWAPNGIVMSQTGYDNLARPTWSKTFGKLQQTLTYHADGTLATVKDGNNHVTTLLNWKRGIPTQIKYPATPDQPTPVSEYAGVSDRGWVEWVKDENGYLTDYNYDAMGRLTNIIHPAESNLDWNITYQSFQQIDVPEYGIPAGHWRQTTRTGNGRKLVYFDALWRPLIVREDDTSQITATRRVIRNAYDPTGRLAFTSYPVADGIPPNVGTHTTYDALGRVTSVAQDSELGPLTTSTTYPSGFGRQTRNPRGYLTTESFQAWDTPAYDAPVRIDAPEGVTTAIARDAFGKPLQVSRSGPDG